MMMMLMILRRCRVSEESPVEIGVVEAVGNMGISIWLGIPVMDRPRYALAWTRLPASNHLSCGIVRLRG